MEFHLGKALLNVLWDCLCCELVLTKLIKFDLSDSDVSCQCNLKSLRYFGYAKVTRHLNLRDP
jgi:hypothetical protein